MSTYHVRDWIEIRREVASLRSRASTLYLRQLAELEARLAASAANSDQLQRLSELGNVTDSGAASGTNRGRASK